MGNYIGNVPASGEFKRLDSIASLFDGSTTQFNLSYNTTSQSVGDASQLIVSLNGIVQEPLESYTLGIGGGSIIFSSAPSNGDTCHIVMLGGVGSTITPTDGSVTATKLDASLKDYYEDEYTADGSTTDFTLSRESAGVNMLLVTIDGIVQPTSAYTASGTTLTISPALPNGTNIRVVHMGVKAGVYVPQAGSVGLNEVDLTAFDGRYYQAGDALAVADVVSSGILKSQRANYAKVSLVNTDTSQEWQVQNNGTNFRITDQTQSGATRLAINATGYVGIGTISPSTNLHISSTGTPTIRIQDADGSDYYAQISQATGNTLFDARFGASNGAFIFRGLGGGVATEYLRLDPAGNLLVGKNVTTYATEGFNYERGGALELTRDAGRVLRVHRTTDNGNIIELNKDSVLVGSIGVEGGDSIYIGNGDTGLKFAGGADAIQPFNPSTVTARTDGGVDLGTTGAPFGDIYLAGGIQFGSAGGSGTSAVTNSLDDYEVGTFTPGIAFGGASTGVTYSVNKGSYIKIGRFVQCYGHLTLASKGTSTGAATITGLPFTVGNYLPNTALDGGGNFTYFSGLSSGTILDFISLLPDDLTNTAQIQGKGDGALNCANSDDTWFGNTFNCRFYCNYISA